LALPTAWWNVMIGESSPDHLALGRPLFGAIPQPSPVLSWSAFLSNGFQKGVADLFGRSVPLRPFLIRLNNEVYFDVTGQSANPGIMVGINGELVPRDYYNEYCHRSLTYFLPIAQKAALAVRQIQDLIESRGKKFAYVITPSKAAVYPEYLRNFP